ncbi:ComEC/Rec2 family competence protein [Paenibacillus aceris]|uniref:Beta-lactamase superfamily II metal-dependent hydrolase n=1 Tax=Paenibacillus aceris TaxID=869555 RepID=A0ABS4HXI1_9BACL|nr:MBL fold metallo-hydrolase [Paenibacillus aceris]MBP1963374.1 beta-lactamase superfamily II metal-dependent hydrolase [Paenibacillus aceris]NHW36122.1 MBL fold metallo-hydrolase [Paenibacillus aceris]
MPSAKVQFLNVGWGDAHLIQLPSGGICLIDGGDGTFSEDQDHPLTWMNRNEIDRLDWMLLTHIHEDHVNGLLDVAKAKRVLKAVLPYEPFELPPDQLVQELGDDFTWRVYRMLASYLELVQILSEQGTEIKWRNEYGSSDQSVIWSEEGITLTHLYPWKGDPLPAHEVLMKALAADARVNLPRFFELSNHDSSVYRLSIMQEPHSSVLFGGDQLEPGWERLAQRTDLRSRIWKVSHHGMEDGFNSRILSWIQPEHCIIPVSV